MKYSFFFDEDGEELQVGDAVMVNSEYLSVVDEDQEGDRYIKGLPEDLIIESVVKVNDDQT